MMTAIEKFQNLLRELFQFDCADLDFGIYRIMNYKRSVIEKFITQDLPKRVAEELARGALAEQAQAAQDLQAARKKVLEALGDDALDAEGNLAETYRTTKAGKEYLAAQERARSAKGREALETAIYNHLYTFFSRYYQDGDFISKRRYSRQERYAIPYNGEEVYLYWANHDQYYVKTAEYFTDYTYQAPGGVTVHFKLHQADVEQNNVKGEKRLFLPRLKEIAWDEKARQVVIPFEYRPLTAQEEIAYGQKNQQEAIIAQALTEIPRQLSPKTAGPALTALTAEKRKTGDGQPVTYLEHHLRQYTRRNTSDFFIHKDLKGFLSRELDFYLKNEVLSLDEMEAAGEARAEGWFQMMRLIKAVGGQIIDFLDQIERFQRMLWEKRKFITETQYCITVGNIAEAFYPEIAANEVQWAEWERLGFHPAENADKPGKADVSSATYGNADLSSATHKGWYSRGHLPHFDAAHTYQFITFRLHDSLPDEVIAQWKAELHWTKQTKPDSKEAIELRKRIEKYEDSGHGACYLRDERIAALVEQALKHFDGEHYYLIAWCIMPNHVHILIQQIEGHPLSQVVQSWKSFTAHEANKLLGRSGDFWMPDYFDRFIRDEKHFAAAVQYIHQNPVKAGLVSAPEEWPWSSAAGGASAGSAAGSASAGSASAGSASAGSASVSDAQCGRDVRGPRINILKAHPSLPLDTRHFDRDFVDRLLASFEDLDEMTDGLLIHGENWQALNLLQEKYRERVKCVYIDPPYNSKTTEILYKNNYKHASWLSLIDNRLDVSKRLATPDGSHIVAIDENEQEVLGCLLRMHFPEHERVCVAVVHNKKGIQGDYFSYNHDYAYFCIPPALPETHGKPIAETEWEYDNLRKWGRESERETARNCFYPIFVEGNRIVGFGDVCDEGFHPQKANVPSGKDGLRIAVYPVDSKGVERKWRYARNSVEGIAHLLKVHITTSGEVQILKAKAETQPKTVWDDSTYIAGDYGTKWLTDLGLKIKENLYPKSIFTVIDSIYAVSGPEAVVADYFAGSATTGHAVINLNREDGGRRTFILVEMADYFDTVLLPRIKKVTFTPEWKDGRPKRMATPEEAERSPRIVKVIRLESYEDALNNIAFDDASGQQALAFEDYLLKYMLRWETKHSATLLNIEKLTKPFSYKLIIHADGQTREKVVDLPETFNYLLGLHVQTRRVYYDAGNAPASGGSGRDARDPGRRYLVYRGQTREGRQVAVIWRETEGWQQADFEQDKQFVTEQKLTEGADEVFVNGDSYIPGARALEPVFKARMFAGMEA